MHQHNLRKVLSIFKGWRNHSTIMNLLQILIITNCIDSVLCVRFVGNARVDNVLLLVLHGRVLLFLVFEEDVGVLVEFPEEDVGVVATWDEATVVI